MRDCAGTDTTGTGDQAVNSAFLYYLAGVLSAAAVNLATTAALEAQPTSRALILTSIPWFTGAVAFASVGSVLDYTNELKRRVRVEEHVLLPEERQEKEQGIRQLVRRRLWSLVALALISTLLAIASTMLLAVNG